MGRPSWRKTQRRHDGPFQLLKEKQETCEDTNESVGPKREVPPSNRIIWCQPDRITTGFSFLLSSLQALSNNKGRVFHRLYESIRHQDVHSTSKSTQPQSSVGHRFLNKNFLTLNNNINQLIMGFSRRTCISTTNQKRNCNPFWIDQMRELAKKWDGAMNCVRWRANWWPTGSHDTGVEDWG